MMQHNPAGGRDVERVEIGRHRDAHAPRPRDQAGGETGAFRAQQDGRSQARAKIGKPFATRRRERNRFEAVTLQKIDRVHLAQSLDVRE